MTKRRTSTKRRATRASKGTGRRKTSTLRKKTPARKRAKRKSTRKRKSLSSSLGPYGRVIGDIGGLALMGIAGLLAVFAYFARDLPDTTVLWRDSDQPRISLIAADGSPIAFHGTSAGMPVRLGDLPAHVPHAIMAVEDRNFYYHFGVNVISVGRAAFVNMRSGAVQQGGSTITQQLAKNVFLSHDRTIKRKVQEVMLAFWLEWNFTKDEILTLYLNRVYFGTGAYGVDAASHRYFGKSARDLEIGEAAVLAGLLKAPTRFAPTSNPEDAGRRGRLVVDQMVRAGFLDAESASRAVAQPIILQPPRFAAAPYFVDFAISQARQKANNLDADLIVYTTFDPVLQSAADIGGDAGFALAGASVNDAQLATILMDGDGAVRALVGGRNYRESQFNRAVQARRQPGSAFKPFVYLAALQAGYGPNDEVDDAPISIGSWSPDNYDSKFYGRVSLRTALMRSLNSAAIRTQETVGRRAVRDAAISMGWSDKLSTGPSLALGVDAISPVNLAASYAPLVNGGYRVTPFVIERIETPDGEVVFSRNGSVRGEAARPRDIAALNKMLEAVVREGTGRAAQIPGHRPAGKTGTSQDSRDAWFAGHVGGLVGVVWIGRDDNAPMPGVTGGQAPAIVWRETMMRAVPPSLGARDALISIITGGEP